MSDAPTEALVQAAQRGSRAAMDLLWERHRPRLLQLIRFRLDPRVRTRVDASDVVQETLARASRDLASYRQREGVPFYAWLRKIAWRQLLKTREQHIEADKRTVLRERRLAKQESSTCLADAIATESTPSGKLAEEELVAKIASTLESLSAIDREVLVLRFLEGLSTAEAAAVLDATAVAVRKRLMRALGRLGLLLEDEHVV